MYMYVCTYVCSKVYMNVYAMEKIERVSSGGNPRLGIEPNDTIKEANDNVYCISANQRESY